MRCIHKMVNSNANEEVKFTQTDKNRRACYGLTISVRGSPAHLREHHKVSPKSWRMEKIEASLWGHRTGLRDLQVPLKTEVKGRSSLLGKMRGRGQEKALLQSTKLEQGKSN